MDGIVAAVRAESPVYGEVLAAPEGMGIRLGIEQAHPRLSGRGRAAAGGRPARPTSSGAAWARPSSRPGAASTTCAPRFAPAPAPPGAAPPISRSGPGSRPPIAIALAEAIFVYGDELATDVVEGYLRMQSDEAGERERRRRRVALLLLDPDGHDPEALARAAELARWPVPRTLAVLALRGRQPAGRHPPARTSTRSPAPTPTAPG